MVHGGESFTAAALINDDVMAAVRKAAALAPLHNPANITGIEVAMSLFPCPQVRCALTSLLPPTSERQSIAGGHAHLYAWPFHTPAAHPTRGVPPASVRASCRRQVHQLIFSLTHAGSALDRGVQVAVFDTAFHMTMPPAAYRYAVPKSLYVEHGIRRYGTSGQRRGWDPTLLVALPSSRQSSACPDLASRA